MIKRSPIPPSVCNLAKTFDLIGERWTLLIIRSALYGVRRFDDFCDELTIPRSVLSKRLSSLVQAGLMRRETYREGASRSRPEYVLTEMGQALALPFIAFTEWGDTWLGKDKQRPVIVKHRRTGEELNIGLVDSAMRGVKMADVGVELHYSPDNG